MSEQPQGAQTLAAYIGLDWADQKHAVCLREAATGKLERYALEHKPEAINAWLRELRVRFGDSQVGIALEQGRGAMINALMGYEFVVIYPVNPKTLARYREAFSPGIAKDDPSDAALLAELVQLHRDKLRAWRPDDEQTRLLRTLVEGRRRTVNDLTRVTNRLTARLKEYFPQALEWAGELASEFACDFLERWPSLTAVQGAAPAEVRAFYRQRGRRKKEVVEQRLSSIKAALPLTSDRAVVEGSALLVQGLVRQLRALILTRKELEDRIAELFADHPDREIFDSLPGAGPVLAPRLSVALGGDRSRYESAQEVQQYSGIAPVTRRSGNNWSVRRRLASPTFVRQTFHEFAAQSILWSSWARAYYRQQRERGKKHNAAVRALAYKWIRVIYKCWKERVPYDETKYLEVLERRGSPLASAIAAASCLSDTPLSGG